MAFITAGIYRKATGLVNERSYTTARLLAIALFTQSTRAACAERAHVSRPPQHCPGPPVQFEEAGFFHGGACTILYISLMPFPAPREIFLRIMRWLAYLVAFFLIAAVVNWFQAPKSGGEKIPSLELATLDGKPYPLNTAGGKKTVLYFFAPWCTVCKASIDALNTFAGSEKVQAVAVGLDYENRGELAAFQNRLDAPVLAGSPALARRLSIDRYPTVYILNGDGSVAHTMVGYASRFGIWLRTKI